MWCVRAIRLHAACADFCIGILNNWLEAMVPSLKHDSTDGHQHDAWADSMFAVLRPEILGLGQAAEVALRSLACVAASGCLGDTERWQPSLCQEALESLELAKRLQQLTERSSKTGGGGGAYHLPNLAV